MYTLGYISRSQGGKFCKVVSDEEIRGLICPFMDPFTIYQIRLNEAVLAQFAGYDADYVRGWLVRQVNYDGSRGVLAWHG